MCGCRGFKDTAGESPFLGIGPELIASGDAVSDAHGRDALGGADVEGAGVVGDEKAGGGNVGDQFGKGFATGVIFDAA